MVKWVVARAKCTVADIFGILAGEVEGDVRLFNSLPPERRQAHLYCVQHVGTELFVRRAKEIKDYRGAKMVLEPIDDCMDDCIHLRHDELAIVASRQGGSPLKVVPRWNEETLTCDFYIGNRTYTREAISQKILGEFLFDDPPISDHRS